MKRKLTLFSIILCGFCLISCNPTNTTTDDKDDGGNATIPPVIDTDGDKTHEHTYNDDWSFDEYYHYHECECGAKDDVEEHKWDQGNITKQATETEDGNITYTCTVCGKTKDETIPKTGTISNGGELPDDGEEWGDPHK